MRPPLRAVVWSELQRLEDAGLGRRVVVSDQRDKFVLDVKNAAADRLSSRPEADGFIRADKGSLLVRDATAALIAALPPVLAARRMNSAKGLEFRWTQLTEADIVSLVDAVLGLSR